MITVVSITRIEADIIESFIRHCLTFADEIIVLDNDSFDGTSEILENLSAEGLPLIIKRISGNVEFNHFEMMTKLCRIAVERGADVVLPIDVDEFLINTDNKIPIRDILKQINRDAAMEVSLIKYQLCEEYKMDEFLLSQLCKRERVTSNQYCYTPKMIIGRDVIMDESFVLGQGCHFFYTGNNDFAVKKSPLHLAHFHYRDEKRYMAKSILGCLGITAGFGNYTIICDYMRKKYRNILKNNSGLKNHTQPEDDIYELIDLRGFIEPKKICYHVNNDISLLATTMIEAQRLARAYAEQKAINRQKQVDVLLPYWGGDRELLETLATIYNQEYNFYKIMILYLNDKPHIADETGVPSCKLIPYGTFDERLDALRSLTGDYVMWLLPGVRIPSNHIQRLLATAELNGYNFCAYIHHHDCRDVSTGNNIFKLLHTDNDYHIINTKTLWEYIVQEGGIPGARLRDVLFPRESIVDVCEEIGKYFTVRTLDLYGFWRTVLLNAIGKEATQKQVFIALANDETDDEYIYEGWNNNEIIEHQLRWFYWLNNDNEILSDVQLKQAVFNIRDKYKVINELSNVDEDIHTEYEKLNLLLNG